MTASVINLSFEIPREQIELLSKRLWFGNYVAYDERYQAVVQDEQRELCTIREWLDFSHRPVYVYRVMARYPDGAQALLTKLSI